MAVFKRREIWWYECTFAGRRVRESARTTSKTVAKEAEKNRRRELERTLAGLPAEKREDRIRSVNDMVKSCLGGNELSHRPKSVRFVKGRLARVSQALGGGLLPDLNEEAIRGCGRSSARSRSTRRPWSF